MLTRSMRRVLPAAVATLGLTMAPNIQAQAITGGERDGDRHPSVGIIMSYSPDGEGGFARYRCSATLVSPTVVLTAAHCTDGTVGKTIVNFDSVIAEQPPSGISEASDPSVGYQADEIPAGWASGSEHTHPEYSDFTDRDNWNDVGVVVLDEPNTEITPSPIASEDTLGAIPRSHLAHTLFNIVGYGTEVRKSEEGPQKPTPQSYPIVRRTTDAPGQKLTPQILQVNGNEHDNRGGGGSCFGDSGGPSFYNGEVVTVTSYGFTANCRYIDGLQRVEIPVVLDWLAKFGVTPAA